MEIKMSALYVYTIIKFILDFVFIILCKWDSIGRFIIKIIQRTV